MTPLTAERVRYIRAELVKGKTRGEISAQIGLSYSYVCRLLKQHPDTPTDLLDRWRNDHKIGDIGKRAAEETA